MYPIHPPIYIFTKESTYSTLEPESDCRILGQYLKIVHYADFILPVIEPYTIGDVYLESLMDKPVPPTEFKEIRFRVCKLAIGSTPKNVIRFVALECLDSKLLDEYMFEYKDTFKITDTLRSITLSHIVNSCVF